MEELKEIEPVGAIVQDGKDYGLIESEVLQGISVLPVGTKLYTAEQMKKHAEAKCWELINWYVESTGDVNHAAEMKIWMDDEFKEKQDEEDNL